jgi:hypothetical protein
VLIADVDPIPLGSVGIAFDSLFSSTLDTKDVVVSFNPRVDLGYRFKENSPYFTVVQGEAPDTITPSADYHLFYPQRGG